MNKGEVYEIKKQKNRKNTSVDCEYYFDFSRNLNVYGFFERQLEAIFLTPEFVRFSLSSFVDTFFLYTKIDSYSLIEFFIIIIKLSALLTALLALLATFTMKHRIFSGVLFLLLAITIAGITSGVAVPVYLLYFIVAIMLFVRKG